MAPDTYRLDPKVEELLRAVAADPESCLLRVGRPKVMPALFETSNGVQESSTGLSTAERELLRVGREEVAWLLREHCRYRLTMEPGPGALTSRYRTPSQPGSPLDLRAMRAAAQAVRDAELDGDSSSALQLLETALGSRRAEGTGIVSMALAAHRLVPSDQSRMLIAAHYAHGDSPNTAVKIASGVLASTPDRTVAAIAWTCVGQAIAMLGDHSKSGGAYAEACRLDEERVTAWMYRLVCAIQAGDEADGIASMQGLERAEQAHNVYGELYVTALRTRRKAGGIVPTPAAMTFAQARARRFTGTARRIVDVFA